MRRILQGILVLAALLVLALGLRVRQLRAAEHGPVGGTGVIEGVDVNVTSRIATRITKVNVREGDVVKRGDLLVELDCAEADAALAEAAARVLAAEATFEASQASARSAGRSAAAGQGSTLAAESQLAALEAQEKLARVALGRAEMLFKEGSVPASTLDDARSREDTLVSQIAGQRASAAATRDQAQGLSAAGSAARAQAIAAQRTIEAGRASVARAEVASRECKLTAPRDAMVTSRNLEPGEPVLPGSAVLALTDVTEARARFYLPNEELAAAAPGRKVRVVADAYPGQAFEGTIYYVSPRAEFTPRNVQTRQDRERLVFAVEVRVPNPDLRLRSGMPVEVTIEGSAR
jgi:HlyD family secretion protein